MEGLLNQARQPQPGVSGGQPPVQESQGRQPDDQAMYERLVNTALEFIYSDVGTDMVLEGLQLSGADFVQNAGNVIAKVLMRLIISVRTSGSAIPAKMMLQAGMELSAVVLDMAEQHDQLPNTEDGMLDNIFFAAITITGRELPEDILTAQERQEIGQTLQEVQQMKGGQ
ncbi:hypothetical protein [Aliamphritea hakodatensis]|uniref:hypothetical protein n=1 Tax=Aliamphritea hakodatensis TaxID=2895352 RepID=UPI0022FD4059|nr:hypothetical protein [Aliamphritea hakodatensis]